MTFKRKPDGMAPSLPRDAALPATVVNVEPLPDIHWLLDERGAVDRTASVDWSPTGYADETAEDLAALERWFDRHLDPDEAERSNRLAAIDAAVADLLASYPGTRVNAAGYARIAREDWREYSAAVITDVARTLRRTVKSLPSSASVREALSARTKVLRDAMMHLTNTHHAHQQALKKGEVAVAELVAAVAAHGGDVSAADLHDAHLLIFHDRFGVQPNPSSTPRALLSAWARLVTALRNGEPWALEWVCKAAGEQRHNPPDQPPDGWDAWNNARWTRTRAITEALEAGRVPNLPEGIDGPTSA